jgi:hypothetical protein
MPCGKAKKYSPADITSTIKIAAEELRASQRVLLGLGGRWTSQCLCLDVSSGHTTHHITRNLRVMDAFTTFALQRDISVAENAIDKIVHGGFLKFAACTSLATELGGTLNFFLQEIANIFEQHEWTI